MVGGPEFQRNVKRTGKEEPVEQSPAAERREYAPLGTKGGGRGRGDIGAAGFGRSTKERGKSDALDDK